MKLYAEGGCGFLGGIGREERRSESDALYFGAGPLKHTNGKLAI
jgi:hypothetical protein